MGGGVRGCGGARGSGAVAAGRTSESWAGMGTELRVLEEDEKCSHWAHSHSHFPPFSIWAGKEGKPLTSPGLHCSWFGGGEKRAAGPFPALLGGFRKGWKEGRRPGLALDRARGGWS